MRKLTSTFLAALLAVMLAVPAAAYPSISGWVQILSVSDASAVTRAEAAVSISHEEISTAVDDGEADRFMVLSQRNVSSQGAVDISLYVCRTDDLPVWLLFRAEGETTWTLLACCSGSTIEASLPGSGTYAVVMAW